MNEGSGELRVSKTLFYKCIREMVTDVVTNPYSGNADKYSVSVIFLFLFVLNSYIIKTYILGQIEKKYNEKSLTKERKRPSEKKYYDWNLKHGYDM